MSESEMSQAPGSRLGSFEILGSLGAGGMGEVYRAKDETLGREVAIKLLPAEFADDEQRLTRFRREAKMLAALNHPNIAAIYDLQQQGTSVFLVMELVEGETLEERLGRGPLDIREATSFFSQVALALGAAHQKGIIHRDLKPANVQVTPDGRVKVLDFGLAKPISTQTSNKSEKKTATYEHLSQGMILGTPAYMSPEQARAQSVDRRADVWSFGCCLFEALTGRMAFDGETSSDILAAVLWKEPDFGLLPSGLPDGIRRLLHRCLRKDLTKRLQDIGDARLELEEALEFANPPNLSGDLPPSPVRQEISVVPRWIWAVALLLIGLVVWPWFFKEPSLEPGASYRFRVALPPAAPLALSGGPALSWSPDGQRFAYVSRSAGRRQIYLRNLSELEPVALVGTRDAQQPFFSPDGAWLGFFAEGKLKKIALAGGATVPLADIASARGAVWLDSDQIAFAPRAVGGLSLVSTEGGAVRALTNPQADETSHRWPILVGNWIVFTVWRSGSFAVEAVRRDGSDLHGVLDDASHPQLVGSEHLLFLRGASLHLTRFDTNRAQARGESLQVLETVFHDERTGVAQVSMSRAGALVYVAEADPVGEGAQLLWLDSLGSVEVATSERRAFQLPRLSPDGDAVLVSIGADTQTDVWTLDLRRDGLTRLTTSGVNGAAVWRAATGDISYSAENEGSLNIFGRRSDGSGTVRRLSDGFHPKFSGDWSPDGSTLLYTEMHPDTGFDIWKLSPGSQKPLTFVRTRFQESAPAFSPDGELVAYVSDETGRDEIYLRLASGDEGKWQVSADGGQEPRFARDGATLFFRSEGWLRSTSIARENSEIVVGESQMLFEAPFDEAGVAFANYDVADDGRFLMVRSDSGASASSIRVYLNYRDELVRRLPSE